MANTSTKKYIRALLPTGAWLAGVTGLVVLLVAYFTAAQYSNVFIEREGVGAFETASQNPLSKFLFFTPWALWVDRALDFLFWGVIAAIVIVVAWAISASKTTFSNHNMVKNFQNFNADAGQWNQGFLTAIILRVLLVFIGLYSLGAVITRFAPGLSSSIGDLLYERTALTIAACVLHVIILWFAIVTIISCVKIFRHIEVN